jgi:predicted amidophosphoribosyltransferase
MSEALVCTSCATPHGLDERFCPDCGLPLVHSPEIAAAAPPVTAAQERARKIRAQYSEGPLVRVAAARHQAEAELLQGMLLEEGIPSLTRRSGGFDVPDFLAAGPRDVLVPQSGASAARETLGTSAPSGIARRANARPWVRALAAALAVLIIATVAAGVVAAVAP